MSEKRKDYGTAMHTISRRVPPPPPADKVEAVTWTGRGGGECSIRFANRQTVRWPATMDETAEVARRAGLKRRTDRGPTIRWEAAHKQTTRTR